MKNVLFVRLSWSVWFCVFQLAVTSWGIAICRAELPTVRLDSRPGEIHLFSGEQSVGVYYYQDSVITRPYFAHLKTPSGRAVTRSHPPVPDKDLVDHDTFHPGMWMAFADINGNDYWRIQQRVQHAGLIKSPQAERDRGEFTVRNQYLDATGLVVCTEQSRICIEMLSDGYLLLWDSEFLSDKEFSFGDQEEMGLGIRMATPLIVKNGGQIRNGLGGINEPQVWGKQSDWCQYSGVIDGGHVGVVLMPHPQNYGKSWFHARDYGLLAANLFGRNAFTGGEKSRIVVRPGEAFRLRYGLRVFEEEKERTFSAAEAYEEYLRREKATQKAVEFKK